jgi:asparagine synthase (glutamine-hydrolysing)
MCGIVGLLSRAPDPRPDLLAGMRDAMRHRGPDDAGAWWSPDGCAGLAHRRLAILDLSAEGHQPMADASGRFRIAFNGEIYNHRALREELAGRGASFRSASDTEVLLEAYRAWGTDCLSRLVGMFSFGLYDTEARRLFLARDRAGEKPLFYAHSPGRFAFASELKGLMADPAFPRELDLESLEYYLAYGYVPGERCILKGVRKLPQGHAATYDLEDDRFRAWRYWALPEPPAVPAADEAALLGRLDTLLEESVRRQLVADVPVGILLSGGIDSSLITAMAARVASGPVKTFTISFPGYGAYDEAPHARLVASHFGTDHTELAAEPASVTLLPELARQFDEPIADSSMVPTFLVSQLVRRHATVALGGDGGDELFGGYRHYNLINRAEPFRRAIPSPVRTLARAAAGALPAGLPGRNRFLSCIGPLPLGVAPPTLYFDDRLRARLLSPLGGLRSRPVPPPELYKAGLCPTARSPLAQATAADFRSYLVDQILVKVDRASMLASLEIRAPWLDHRIVEFAFGEVPDALRATRKARKVLPRRLAARLLPPGFDLDRKQGFSAPLSAWFRSAWGDFMESVLLEAPPGLFDGRFLRELVAGQRKGYGNIARLFALTMFELWRREYRVSFGGPP